MEQKKLQELDIRLGIGYPPDWGEHTLNISKGDMTVLKPNITFHMIAVMQFGNWGVEASEAIRVTETGHELFCNFSKELHIKSQLLMVDIFSNKCFKVTQNYGHKKRFRKI